jgi:hypothetical protein
MIASGEFLSIIISSCNEERTLQRVIQKVLAALIMYWKSSSLAVV